MTRISPLAVSLALCLCAIAVVLWAHPIWFGAALLLAALAVVVSPPD